MSSIIMVGPSVMDACLLALFVIAAVLVIICLLCCKNNHNQDQQQANARLPEEIDAHTKSIAIALLNRVTYPRRRNAAAGGDPDPSAAETLVAEDCAICLGPFEDGDLCSIMPVCRHEFHRDCIVNWLLMANNNTCPLCRAQLQWSAVAENMV